jgi:hypothetical protein
MSIQESNTIEILRRELDKLVERRTTGGLSDSEWLRYQQLCDEECERLRKEYG